MVLNSILVNTDINSLTMSQYQQGYEGADQGQGYDQTNNYNQPGQYEGDQGYQGQVNIN